MSVLTHEHTSTLAAPHRLRVCLCVCLFDWGGLVAKQLRSSGLIGLRVDRVYRIYRVYRVVWFIGFRVYICIIYLFIYLLFI